MFIFPSIEITKSLLKDVNGKRRLRLLTENDVTLLYETIQSDEFKDASVIRVYPTRGFVANAYKGKCRAYRLTAYREGDSWSVKFEDYDCHRAHGVGPRGTRDDKAIRY